MMEAVKSALRFGLHQAGGLNLIRHVRRSGVRILNYHRFSDVAAWDRQCAHLAEFYHLTTLREVAAAFRAGRTLPPKTIAITVDDGYRDFYTHAFPVVQRYKIPVTVFLVSDFIDGRTWLWWDQIAYALEHTQRGSFEGLPLGTAGQRRVAIHKTVTSLKARPDAERRAFLDRLGKLAGIEIPQRPPQSSEPLTWDEIREMSRAGIDFGAHTVTHPILPRIESPDELYREIAGAKQRIEAELDRPADMFCYPNGDWDQRSISCVEQAGYQTAVTMQWGRNLRPSSPYLLERTPVDPSWPQQLYEEVVAYGYPWRTGGDLAGMELS